ncbi:MAG: UvrD-helicase domain-containing protein [Patescibacteria group bacterium]|nr:UvrD-helicase domain-containing protein [Patescibacteria group bacterium]MDE1945736.1 UvrD-helicase domain-containing protein [Patescibacteria group bacterium]
MNELEGLNERQKEAVMQTNGPVLIIAGAGAGKTKTIVHRILHLIKEGVAPEAILAITFTNKAAKEMRERVEKALASDKTLNLPTHFPGKPFVSTFHSLGVRIIKENAQAIGLTRHFAILDRSDSSKIVKECLAELSIDPKQFEPAKILNRISREKGNLTTAEEFSRDADRGYTVPGVTARVWPMYEAKLAKDKSLDFDDLLLKTYEILRDHPRVLEHYQELWKYIHIDEYQDTNKVQYAIAKLLAAKYKNMTVVGDIDQSIYSWRGADIQNILDFEKDYPDAKTILLEENYRSTQTILAAANEVIKKNAQRREKNLFTKNAKGEKISYFRGTNETEEARFIARKASELTGKGVPAREIAVLYRANFQSRALEEAMLAESVPYQVLGTKFFERREVRDILAYLGAALDPEQLASVKRIINIPARGIGKVTMLKIFEGNRNSLPSAVGEKVNHFYRLLERIKKETETKKPSEVLRFIIKESGLELELQKGTEEDKERLENMRELATLATKYDYLPKPEGIEKLLEEAALATDQDSMEKNENAVKLMTVHASKGLEFDYVFITGLEQDLFPHQAIGKDEKTPEEMEEERRLFYVALTRARKKLFLTHAEMRTIFGSTQVNLPSEFFADFDSDLLEEEKFEFRDKIIYLDW